jgi:hypothetical protein
VLGNGRLRERADTGMLATRSSPTTDDIDDEPFPLLLIIDVSPFMKPSSDARRGDSKKNHVALTSREQ